jgi:hypothetical protein
MLAFSFHISINITYSWLHNLMIKDDQYTVLRKFSHVLGNSTSFSKQTNYIPRSLLAYPPDNTYYKLILSLVTFVEPHFQFSDLCIYLMDIIHTRNLSKSNDFKS